MLRAAQVGQRKWIGGAFDGGHVDQELTQGIRVAELSVAGKGVQDDRAALKLNLRKFIAGAARVQINYRECSCSSTHVQASTHLLQARFRSKLGHRGNRAFNRHIEAQTAPSACCKPALLPRGIFGQPHWDCTHRMVPGPRWLAASRPATDSVAFRSTLVPDRRRWLRSHHCAFNVRGCALRSYAEHAVKPGDAFHRLLPYIASDPGPVGEEFGWRGFALPLLLEQYSPLKASLILGVIHGLWHVPLFFIPGTTQSQLFFPIFMVGTISLAIIDTVLYLRTGANLLLAILVHVMSNSFCLGLSPYQISFFIAGEAALAGAMVLAGGLRSNEQRTAIHDHEADARALGSGGGGPG